MLGLNINIEVLFLTVDKMDSTTLQADEIEALSAIYGSEWVVEDELNRVFSITLKHQQRNSDNERQIEKIITLQFRLPPEYPLEAPPFYVLSAPWMSRSEKINFMSSLEEIYCNHAGESILYLWIEKAREYFFHDENEVELNESSDESQKDEEDFNYQIETSSTDSRTIDSPSGKRHRHRHSSDHHNSNVPIYHGEPIIDRRSTFQAHLAPVRCVQEAAEAIASLKTDKKIANATHNISAYRISGGPHNTCIQDCDDDGENHAGARLLHLLQILDVKDVIVVVSRWFGGIHLGPDRFKHINSSARDLLQKCGYLENQANDELNQGNKKKRK